MSRSLEGPLHRTTYARLRRRALRVAKRLVADGIGHGDRVGTLAWNTWRHLEAWYGIPGAGAVIHTINPRLFPEQIAWIINHAADRVMMVDLTFVPLLEALAGKLPSVERVIVMTDAAHMPATGNCRARSPTRSGSPTSTRTSPGVRWTSGRRPGSATRPARRARRAACCTLIDPTSSTPGWPARATRSPRAPRDSLLMIVPMFHANAWAIGYAAPMAGAKLVMPGARLDGDSVFDLMEAKA